VTETAETEMIETLGVMIDLDLHGPIQIETVDGRPAGKA